MSQPEKELRNSLFIEWLEEQEKNFEWKIDAMLRHASTEELSVYRAGLDMVKHTKIQYKAFSYQPDSDFSVIVTYKHNGIVKGMNLSSSTTLGQVLRCLNGKADNIQILL